MDNLGEKEVGVVFYNSKQGYGYCIKDVFETINIEVSEILEKNMTHNEIYILTKGTWEEVRKKIINIIEVNKNGNTLINTCNYCGCDILQCECTKKD